MNWTKEQEQVIYLRNRNILVSAAAGSGKTAVLVERIIQIITDSKHPVDIDRLLIVTFTSAAAGEMRERIANAIEARLAKQPDDLHLQRQMTLIHSAQITTIHSFCLSIIRNYFNEIDLDPGFRIGDDAELRLMKTDVLARVLEEKYSEGDPDFLQFVESYATGKSDAMLEDMVLRLYEFSMSYPWPLTWLEEIDEVFLVDSLEELEDSKWMGRLLTYLQEVLHSIEKEITYALTICTGGNGPYMYEAALLDDQDFVKELVASSSYKDLEKAFFGREFMRLSSKKDETVDPALREEVKLIRDQYKSALSDLKSQFFFQTANESLLDMQRVRPIIHTLLTLTKDFMDAYAKKKEEKNVLDFHDMEHFALRILTKDGKPTSVAKELQAYYEEILVDEYQDSNLVQETLIESISKESQGGKNRFMVGDVKQSIYKFRLARPELFIEKYNAYTAEDSLEQRIDLHMNFRSRKEVLDSINAVFYRIMHASLGKIEYDSDAALNPGAAFPETDKRAGGKSEIILLDANEALSDSFREREKEAHAIVTRIEQIKEEGFQIYDKGAYREASYGDMVILLRSMSGWAETFTEVFSSRGIPAYADTQTGYFSAIDVQVILNYLLIIDNPLQDIPFTSVLHSYIGGFQDEELGRIRANHLEGTMYESLCSYKEGDALSEKIDSFLEQLNRLRDLSFYTSVYDLIQDIYHTTGYYDYVTLLPAGNVRKGNLDMLLAKALDFEATSYQGLFHFNRYIEKLHQFDIDYGEASTGGDRHAVRIMSIHKSKGLEFPIVFVAAMGKQFNQQDARSRLILHSEFGVGPDYIDFENRMKNPTLIKKVIQKEVTLENLAEELRVLYVAMTRAKEKLILIGQIKDVPKHLESWSRKKNLTYLDLTKAANYFDWVMPCALEMEELFLIKEVSMLEIMGAEFERQITKQEKREYLLKWEEASPFEKSDRQQIYNQLNHKYSYQDEFLLPSKISVSELKKRAYEEEQEAVEELFSKEQKEAYLPAFKRKEETMAGAALGTVYHKAMQHLRLGEISDKESLLAELKRLLSKNYLKSDEFGVLDQTKLQAFVSSKLCGRMGCAQNRGELFREQPFVLGIPANRIYPEIISEELIIVQGIVDAYFEEEGELVLVDYKTDRVRSSSELVARYRTQMDYYQEALSQITGKRVKERIIYSFYLSKAITIS
ncbi:MAG: ATP-dependent helicase/nuclease subunit [Clostridiales bacterium]|nr:ATP-dependent helicase/nuclease subunit [Clostridiales bacterium]